MKTYGTIALLTGWICAASFAQTANPPARSIDTLTQSAWQSAGIQPARVCSDEVFVRRVYLDVIGTLPTANEALAFLEDQNPDKRNLLIDRLLDRDEFADYWAMKWCELLRVKSEFPINLWPNAVQAYHRWIRICIKQNMPYDQFVREMLTASGSNIRKPQVNFYRAVQSKDSRTLAQAAALTFMGMRLENEPEEIQTRTAEFFSRVGYKTTSEWKEEVVFFNLAGTASAAALVFPDGTTIRPEPQQDPRALFADWLIRPENPWFTRNIANRIWSWLLGRGIIHEPDDIRAENPPVNPELLTFLEQEMITSGYDMKHLFRLILRSQTYQRACSTESDAQRSEALFACYSPRRLEAEVLIDAIDQITGSTEKYISRIPEPFTFIPEEKRTIELADASVTSPFLDLFGRSPRNTGLESEQSGGLPTAPQELHLLNSSHIRNKLEQSQTLRALIQSAGTARKTANLLYLTVLSRQPDDEEVKVFETYSRSASTAQQAGLDLAWALINSAEFQFRH